MQLLEDLQKEQVRMQILNQRYGFLLNSMQYIKIRQAGAPGDLKFDIMEKKVTAELERMINDEVKFQEPAQTPKPTTPLTVL